MAPALTRFVCIHGHFYQPPRENPFTGRVPLQPSAAPYHDWNERITHECYAANAVARILDGDGSTARTVNNYRHISSDFGPTLLVWLEENAPDTYRAVITADQASARRFGGHGSAMAQAYNHTILPLSNSRDRVTQVRWGIADFRHRFGRHPEGMWLPETAADTESLAVLVAEGIRFTVLSPYQAAAVENAAGDWDEAQEGRVDTRIPYRVDVPGGGSIAVFFYNGPLSQEIAFNGLLEDGHELARRLLEAIGENDEGPVLSHVATDGETYGHHHRFGEMALATAIAEIEKGSEARLTNYGQFLDLRPPGRKARLVEASSWSCAHGVERWRADCGCHTGMHPEWSQAWRAPLREALDWLRDEMIGPFEQRGGRLFSDPWAARDDYIAVILGGSVDEFLARHAPTPPEPTQRELALDLLRIQYHAMLMYTSCGWFFDDIAGLEAVFVLRHAGRVVELARDALGADLEPELLARLDKAPSNIDGMTGADVYRSEVAPFMGRNRASG